MFSKIYNLQIKICIVILILMKENSSYEKTLRKIVRNQSKMVPRPFSDIASIDWNNKTPQFPHAMIFPGYAQVKTVIHKMQRPKISTILSSVETSRSKATYSKMKMTKNNSVSSNELRSTRNVFDNVTHPDVGDPNNVLFPDFDLKNQLINTSYPGNIALETFYHIPATSRFFSNINQDASNKKEKEDLDNNTIIIPVPGDDRNLIVQSIFKPANDLNLKTDNALANILSPKTTVSDIDADNEKPDFILEEVADSISPSTYQYNISIYPYICSVIPKSKADFDALKKFTQFDVEAPWILKKGYWNRIFNSRYEYLMRNPKWPSLKVILVPRRHVDSIWKRSFDQYHNDSVNMIISNIVKKLKFYTNLTFQWNEVSHLSHWWKYANKKTRAGLRRLVKGGRLEITTGGWVETDEATSDLFGLVHLLIEGHQWLKVHLNYMPKVAWLTNSVSHSPTMTYLLSASGISKLIITNLHYSWEKYFAEYQLSDFVWVQDWDNEKSSTVLNEDLGKIGNDRYPKHSVFTHYLQFNSAGLKACGPNGDICVSDFDFGRTNINLDVDAYNIKNKSETLLEQYSKAGTTTPHNIIIAPIGGPYHYESQTEFDFQYNNYKKISDFINANRDIYRTTIEFGTPSNYFSSVFEKHKSHPTIKGDFLNFADIKSGNPAYWVGYFTSRPLLKISLRRLQSTLRTTELLFTFALSVNSLRRGNYSNLSTLLLRARETVARLQDRNVVSGTLTISALKYVHNQIVATARDCWHIQEVAASLLSARPDQNRTYLQKYVNRDGEFTTTFRTVAPGDQIYVFNSLSHERTDVVELMTRYPNVRIVDHNKKEVTIQINPVWKYTSDNLLKISKDFFKIIFVITVPPMTLELFKLKGTYDAVHSSSTIYCIDCIIDEAGNSGTIFPFNIQPIEIGDIQLENYKHRLVFDEFTGFLKKVVDKETNTEKIITIDYGAFRSSNENSGMFLFNTNVSRPLYDILQSYRIGSKAKIMIITSGQVTTEITAIYGRLLQHTVKIFNLMNSPLSSALFIESKIDLDISPSNREVEIFLSVQTDIVNGNHPEIFIDNNGFQYTSRVINISRRVESNMYPMTSMTFIQDQKHRLTIITDHAQGVTALQEGQLIVMLDRRVLYNDGRGTNEGLADSTTTVHRHYILLENFAEPINDFDSAFPNIEVILPSLLARHLANALNYVLDIYLIDKNETHYCYYAFLPLLKTSFPCDVAVINYRAVFNKQLEKTNSNSALMTLHRQSFTCQIDYTLYQYCNGGAMFNLDKILRYVKDIYKTNLVGTSDNEPVVDLDHGNFPPMELLTVRIFF
ncbi:alpha-mannosidase 2-like [Epargyreus clarus]|uniref:alpha-mannosidase 2-like n=1 Tax=Epargyreus clarus TaxID=520877 RepID=UPI003C30E41C